MTHLYDEIGAGYWSARRPDPRIAAAILRALDQAETVVNVGAGAGSYEPSDRSVLAVEPSTTMIRQRRVGSAPVVQASATENGFLGAYWRRPHAYLDAGVRSAISTFAKIRALEPGLARLRRDWEDGTWGRRHVDLGSRPDIDVGYRLLVSRSTTRRGCSDGKTR